MIGCSDVMIKVCGLTRQEDADLCVELKVNLAGFIFHPASPRAVTPEQVAAIDTPDIMRVGVFVDQDVAEVRRIMDVAGLHLAQLHGDQDVEFCERLGRMRVMRTFWPERYPDRADLAAEMQRYEPVSRFFLLDAGASGGGHGRAMDFSRLKGLKPHKTWFLAGGLGPDNLMKALEDCDPCGVDLNSGVEASPGVKDPDKLRQVNKMLCAKRRT